MLISSKQRCPGIAYIACQAPPDFFHADRLAQNRQAAPPLHTHTHTLHHCSLVDSEYKCWLTEDNFYSCCIPNFDTFQAHSAEEKGKYCINVHVLLFEYPENLIGMLYIAHILFVNGSELPSGLNDFPMRQQVVSGGSRILQRHGARLLKPHPVNYMHARVCARMTSAWVRVTLITPPGTRVYEDRYIIAAYNYN